MLGSQQTVGSRSQGSTLQQAAGPAHAARKLSHCQLKVNTNQHAYWHGLQQAAHLNGLHPVNRAYLSPVNTWVAVSHRGLSACFKPWRLILLVSG